MSSGFLLKTPEQEQGTSRITLFWFPFNYFNYYFFLIKLAFGYYSLANLFLALSIIFELISYKDNMPFYFNLGNKGIDFPPDPEQKSKILSPGVTSIEFANL